MLNLCEKIVLSILDEKKSKISWYAYNLSRYGVKAAIVLKLLELKRIAIENKKMVVTDETPTGDEILDTALRRICSAKGAIRLSSWFYSYAFLGQKLRIKVLDKLEDKGIIMQHEKRLLGFIPLKRYEIINTDEKQKIISQVRDILLGGNCPDRESIFLVSLIIVCGYTKAFLTKDEIKGIKDKIKKIKMGTYFQLDSGNLSEILKAIRYAMAAQTAAAASAGG